MPPFLGLRGQALTIALIILIVLPSYVIFGYNQANLGGLVGLEDWTSTFPEIDTTQTTGSTKSRHATLQGLVIASFTLGAIPGCLSCSYTADRFGRKPVIFTGALVSLVGEILEASSFELTQLIAGRVILGVGVGILSGVVPTWLSELSSSKHRGKQVVLTGLFLTLGYVLQAWINLGFFFTAGAITWRVPISICTFFNLLIIAVVFYMPESPRWLIRVGRDGEAIATMSALKDLTDDSAEIMADVAAIHLSLEESTGNPSLLSLVKMDQDRLAYRFGICMLLQLYQQLSGGNLISVYSTIIFQQGLGLDAETSRILSGGALTWKLAAGFIPFFIIDRFGRRVCLMISGSGMAACMLGLTVATSFPKSDFAAQVISVLFVFLFNLFLPIGFLGANFLYCAEVAPLRLRVAMSSISTANHWLWNFVVTIITPVAIANIGYRYYIVYTIIGALIPLSIYYLFPETMGLGLEDIDLIFRDSPSALGIVRYSKMKSHRTETDEDAEKPAMNHKEKALF
ncbi:putative sugar transporter [Xylaria cf. heliscus]|nr:putative sugar transporter [Xylaria cf. heliscus]